MAKTILLVGAPTYGQVSANLQSKVGDALRPEDDVEGKTPVQDWRVSLKATLQTSSRISGNGNCLRTTGAVNTPYTAASPFTVPQWRLLPLHQDHMRTNLTQRSWLRTPYGGSVKRRKSGRSSFVELGDREEGNENASEEDDISFLTATSASSAEEDDFLEHSFAIHTSTLPNDAGATTSSDTTDSSALPSSPLQRPRVGETKGRALNIKPTPLAALSTASQIIRANPATITAHLVVGLITLHEPRRLHVRRTGKAVDLVEAVVGDETGAGFIVSIWIDIEDESQSKGFAKGGLKDDLTGLRTGDVLLMQNVALAVFRGRVHGQSLSRGSAGWKGRTSVRHLWRRGGVTSTRKDACEDVAHKSDELESLGSKGGERDTVLQRTKAVRDWVLRFIAPPPVAPRVLQDSDQRQNVGKKRRQASRGLVEELPPNDTQ